MKRNSLNRAQPSINPRATVSALSTSGTGLEGLTMKCIIHGPNVKFFARALYSLAKIGEDLYLEAQKDGLALRSSSSSRSAFLCYLFNPPFFSGYYLNSDPDECGDDQQDDEEGEEPSARCKLSMKAILMAFRSMGTLDKTIESCTISISAKISKTKIEHHCNYGVLKTYTLPFIECESIKGSLNAGQGGNKFTSHPKVLTEVALNFLSNQEEVTMSVDDNTFTMKNFFDSEEDARKTVHTELKMAPVEFQFYSIAQQSTVTFCLKELRAFIGFADAYNLPVSVSFDTAGKPIVFSIKSPETIEGVLVLATLIEDEDEPDYPTVASTHQKTQSATNQVASCNVTFTDPPRPQSPGAEPNESQASISFRSKRRISGHLHPHNRNHPPNADPQTPRPNPELNASQSRPNVNSLSSRPNPELNASQSIPNVNTQTSKTNSELNASQSRPNVNSQMTQSRENIAPPVSQSRLENLNRNSASIFGSRSNLSGSRQVSNEASLSNMRASVANNEETPSSLVFRSKRRISGGFKGRLAAYNENTDSENEEDNEVITRERISETRDFSQRASHNSSRPNFCDVTQPHDLNNATQRELIEGTPPSAKRARFFFQRCFDATFNPSKISGAEKILAPDSDEDK